MASSLEPEPFDSAVTMSQFDDWQAAAEDKVRARKGVARFLDQPGGLPSGWRFLYSVDETYHIVECTTGVAMIFGATEESGGQHFLPAILSVNASLGHLMQRHLTFRLPQDTDTSIFRVLLPYYNLGDPVEAGEQVLVALGAEPTLIPAAAFQDPLQVPDPDCCV